MFFPRLTKSLHTVTAVANVARHNAPSHRDPVALARESLAILGYSLEDYSKSDPTIVKIMRECSIIIGMRARVAA